MVYLYISISNMYVFFKVTIKKWDTCIIKTFWMFFVVVYIKFLMLSNNKWYNDTGFISSPTPDVYWTKNNTNLPDRYEVSSGGQELTIPDLTEDDAGTYQCFAANAVTETRVRRNFVLRVECKGKKIFLPPSWA